MQMLRAVGIPLLTDEARSSDESNRHGYFEWEPIKQLARNPQLIAEAEGKAVKVISFHLVSLPAGFNYRVIFMERDLSEIAASQRLMIARLGAQGSSLPEEQTVQALTAHYKQVNAWITSHPDLPVLRVQHRELMTDASRQSARVADFLGLDGQESDSMASQVDLSQWRNRVGR
jgi:hypothetical protein